MSKGRLVLGEPCPDSLMPFILQDEDEDVYKRDFSAPTLEDHFNKTILPKVMQVCCVCDEIWFLLRYAELY